MKRIIIEIISHESQRYDTAGDWLFDDAGDLHMRVSDMGNWKYEALVGFHELAEVLLCKARGILQADVDSFDMKFDGEGEPGDSPNSPYAREHFFATSIERLMAAELGVDWAEYEKAIEGL